ncbi:hypothetical protein QBC40DRAFT_144591, partial [Triangularia verruculosa]
LDLCSFCPGFGTHRQALVKFDSLREFFEDPSFFPPCNDTSTVVMNNLTLLFRAIHFYIDIRGGRLQAKEVAIALGNQGLFGGFKATETKLLDYRKQYLANEEGPAYPPGPTDNQEYLLALIDEINDFVDVQPSLGAMPRHASCREKWGHFLLKLKVDG